MVERRLPLEDCEADGHLILDFVERFHACAKLEEHAAEGPYIRRKTQYAIKLLRWHVAKRTLVGCLRGLGLVQLVRNAKVDQFDEIVVGREKYVGRFQVLVDDLLAVEVADA